MTWVRIRWNEKHGAYGLWDPEIGWVDKFGRASDTYYAETREVAVMRRRDLNQWRKDLATSKDVPVTPERTLEATETLERAAESLARLGDLPNAIALWALVLRLRSEAGCLPVT